MQPPVLLVHGFASSFQHSWQRFGWPALLEDEGRRVIGVDLLGHGTAPRPVDPHAYAVLDTYITACRGDHPVIDAVGFSAGARILLRMAVENPASVRKLVLIGIGDSVFEPRNHETLASALTAGPCNNPAYETIRQLANKEWNDPQALASFLKRPEKPFTITELARLEMQVLLITGGRDDVGDGKRVRSALPQVTHVCIPDSDHFALTSHPDTIEVALRFLAM